MVDEQEIVMNFADILAETFICESALLRVKIDSNKELDQNNLAIKRAANEIVFIRSFR
ncbi:MAG: hypothetical protein R2728_13800 [Chitinophagales bacterium]